jgi:two-component system response regulator YesN
MASVDIRIARGAIMVIDVADVQNLIVQRVAGISNPQDVAERLGVPYHTLRKEFRRKTGMTLGKFIIRTRVKQAKQLLTITDLLCFEVSYAVGFSREDVAARTFKAHTGMTMQGYRRRFSDGEEGTVTP